LSFRTVCLSILIFFIILSLPSWSTATSEPLTLLAQWRSQLNGTPQEVLDATSLALDQGLPAHWSAQELSLLQLVRGLCFQRLGENPQAAKSFEKALATLPEEASSSLRWELTFELARTYQFLGRYDESLQPLARALSLAEAFHDHDQQAQILAYIGVAYRNMGEMELAEQHIQQGLQMVGDQAYETRALLTSTLGTLKFYLREFEEARRFYLEAVAFYQKLHHSEVTDKLAGVYNNLGNTCREEDRLEDAFDYYQQAWTLAQQARDGNLMAVLDKNLGLTYQKMGRFEEAVASFQRSMVQAEKGRFLRVWLEATTGLARTWYDMEAFQQAYDTLTLAMSLQSEFLNHQNSSQIDMVRESLKQNLRQKELIILQERQKKNIGWLLALCVSLILAMALVAFSRYRLQVKSLRNSKEQLEEIATLRERLLETLKKYRAFFRGAPEAILVVAQETDQIVEANDRARTLFGIPDPEQEAIPLKPRIGEDNHLWMCRQLNSGTETTGPSTSFSRETMLETPKGTLHVEMTLQPLVFGRKAIVQCFFRDISQRKRLETQLIHAQKMEAIGTLAGGVAHDFNNLLTIIRGYSQMLLRRFSRSEESYRAIEKVDQAASRAEALTRQLLLFSRKQANHYVPLNFNEIITQFMEFLDRLLGPKIQRQLILSPKDLWIRGDKHQLEMVLMNLAVNAKQAMPEEQGSLTIQTLDCQETCHFGKAMTSPPCPCAQLVITDSGKGMSEEIQRHIFEPFFTTKSPSQGTGLGLSTVFGIVQDHGGFIDVTSREGQGTTFRLRFPLTEDRQEPICRQPHQVVEHKKSLTVLLAEDQEEVRLMIVDFLENEGCRVLSCETGERALLTFTQMVTPPDVILTDVLMPGLNGREWIKKLDPSFPRSRVIYLSGFAENCLNLEELEAEGSKFMQKPFFPETLLKLMRSMTQDP
jgi:PAS domain S-box-containing protein